MKICFCACVSSERIDKFLSTALKIGRKKAVKLIENRLVKVNGFIAEKSFPVEKKSLIEADIPEPEANFNYSNLKILYEDNNLVTVYKPPFFHSVKSESNVCSVEHFLSILNPRYILLNRLDFITQGILIAAKNEKFAYFYKNMENNLKIRKKYITFLKGRVEKPLLINFKINQKKRKKVKVEKKKSDTNITLVQPLSFHGYFTMCNIVIFKGARHQIRAHCSHVNHHLIGDIFYGDKSPEKFFFLLCYGYELQHTFNIDLFLSFKNKIKDHLNFLEKNMEFLK